MDCTVNNKLNTALGMVTLNTSGGSVSVEIPGPGPFVVSISKAAMSIIVAGQTTVSPNPGPNLPPISPILLPNNLKAGIKWTSPDLIEITDWAEW